MKRILLGLAMAAMTVSGQSLAQGDRDYALSELHGTRKLFLDSVAGLSKAQLEWKPSAEAWSIAQIAEHIAVSEESLAKMAKAKVAEPATPEKKKANPRQVDEQLVKTVPVRDQKFKAPEMLQPAGRYKSFEELVAAFKKERDANLTYIRETKDDLRGHFLPHPVLGEVDCLQWFLLTGAHTERHVNQINEVKAAAGFPKK